jgi:hypothetical protein
MAKQQLATYLNNHLAGSVTALNVLSSLEENRAEPEIAHFAAELRAEIEAEQHELKNLMERLQIAQDKPRQAAGWLTEKFSQLKLRWDDPHEGALYFVEALELMLVSIEGKRSLWRGLAAAAVPGLPISEYEALAARSAAQQQRVDAIRLQAVKRAFAIETP